MSPKMKTESTYNVQPALLFIYLTVFHFSAAFFYYFQIGGTQYRINLMFISLKLSIAIFS